TVAGLLTYMTGSILLLTNLALTLAEGRSATPAALHMTLAYLWMVVPAFFAPFILFAPQLIRPPAVEGAALQGLVNGWLLGIAMGALPLVLRSRQDGSVFDPDATHDRGSWHSVAALNLGVALVWATAVVTSEPAVRALMVGGYTLIGLAWLPFLRRVWSAVTAIN
ncbi:MAG TPA: hypothetical protein VNT75_31735, partial [Symbiobacteriaceae bacterium]|nr:hypothetical protein [Symbiobacteriaceae bacterium]